MRIRTRHQWGASVPLGPSMALPARRFFVHHSVTSSAGDADAGVRTVERIGRDRFGRMSYSYLSHPAAPDTIHEGAGFTVGAHTGGYNSTSFGLCYVGNYHANLPTDDQILTGAELYAHLVLAGHLVRGAPIIPHRSVKATSCPGDHLVARLERLRAEAERLIAGGNPGPVIVPPVKPATGPNAFDREVAATMDTIDLRNAHKTPVRGRHVDNLQGLLLAAAQMPGLEEVNPAPRGGQAVDGVAGSGTRHALLQFQHAARYFGLYTGSADAIVGEGTWRALISF